MIAQDGAFDKSAGLFDGILAQMEQSAFKGRTFCEVESSLHEGLRQLGQVLLQEWVDSQGSGDLGPTLEHRGRRLRRLEHPHDRRLVTVFGELTIRRTVYGTRETQKHELVPLDARLGLLDSEFSPLLEDWAQSMCVQHAYSKAQELLERMLGLRLTVRGLQSMNARLAERVRSVQDIESVPPEDEEGEILVVTADGKGIPMRRDGCEGTGQAGKRRGKGEKKNKKRQACVGAVYTIEPFRRTARDIVDEVRRRLRRGDRPKPRHKQVRAELTREIDGVEHNGKALTFAWLAEQAYGRNRQGARAVVCLMDGDASLWRRQKHWLPEAKQILDLYHALERLWTAAHCFHAEGSEEAEAFVEDRLMRILAGEVGRVIGGLKQMITKRGLRGSRRKRLESVITYFENNRQFMKYDEYLKAGYPIGSGVVEGACRHLVKDRMELTGMRWRLEGAQAMLDLRAVYLNDRWDQFNRYRVRQEQRRLYPYRARIQSQWRVAA